MTLRDLWLRIRALAAPRTVDRELDEELAFHLEMETRKLIASGQTLADARALARARFGPASAADACRDARASHSSTAHCGTCATRSLRRPAVTITIVVTIALGLGLSTAVFTIFNALVFRPDAIRDPDSLYSFTWSTRGQPRHRFTLREYDAFRRENEAFTDVAARNFDLTTRLEGHAAEGQLVSGNYFQVLGVKADGQIFLRLDSVVLPTDVRVVMFAVAAAAVSASLFGLMPALQATRAQLVHSVRENLRSNQRSFSLMRLANGPRTSRLRSALIVVQVTASALFLICAVIFLRGAGRAAAVDPGGRVSDTLIVDNPANEASRPAIIELLASQPSVSATATAWPAPLLNVPRQALAATFTDATSTTDIGGLDAAPTSYRFVSSGYFEVLGIDVLSGRTFSNEEGVAHAPVAVLSESSARQFWPAGNAIGQQLRVLRDTQVRRGDEPIMPPPVVTVIGIVRDVRGYSPSGNGSDNTAIYLPSANTDPKTAMVVRVHGDPDVTRRTLTERLAAVDPNVGMIITMRSLGALRTYPMQLGFWVIVALGMLALAFTLSGIYGVLSYLVEQRTKEIGVRIALGATAANVTRLVLWQSLRLVGFGLAAGVFLAWIVSTILTSKLPVTGPFAGVIQLLDGVAYGASLLVICLACVCAASIPASRAARIDPISALRHE